MYLLGEETEDEFSYFLNAIPFLYRAIQSVQGTGQLMQPGTIICSQFKMKFLLVPSQIAPSVKATLCGLACQLPACLSSASASGVPASLFYTRTHTPRHTPHHHWSPECAGWGRYRAAPLQAVLPACRPAGVLLLQLLIPELTLTQLFLHRS